MAYYVSPPQFDEATGEYVGEPIVENREMQRGINQVSIEDIDPSEYNDALEPHYARKAALANLPIFDENANDADVVAFWRRTLTEAEVDAVQAAYVATDNELIANLLAWNLTGDESFLSDEQRDQLGLDDSDEISSNETEDTNNQEFNDDYLAEIEEWIIDNVDEPDPGVAQSILDANIGTSDEAATVQYLAYQYYNGQISLEEAYNEALNTGLSHDKLYSAFQNLYNQTQINA